jgi:enterochelin esterase-like enzyme
MSRYGDTGPARQASEQGLTRAQFLTGAGASAALVLGGGLLVERALSWRWWTGAVQQDLHHLRSLTGSSGATVNYTLHSRYVSEPVPWAIAWPPGTKPGDRLPVVFALPGRGGGPPMHFAEYVAQAVKAKAVEPFAVVGVDGGQSYWHPRADGEDRLSMLLDEIIPLCSDKHGLGGHGHKRALIGWSMGGYGALLAAETRPRDFAAVCGVGPAVWTSYAAEMLGPRDAFDNAADFAAHDVIAHADRLRGLQVRINCGTSDPFYCYVTHLTEALAGHWSGGYGKGGHDYQYWDTLAPAQVRFLGRALT